MINEQLAPLRVYRSADVVGALGIKKTWFKRWVTDRRVPHQRSGVVRGVWFTWNDIVAIGAMLPELMGGRRGVHRTGTPEGQQAAAPARPEPSAETLAGWAQLSAHRPTPRTAARRH